LVSIAKIFYVLRKNNSFLLLKGYLKQSKGASSSRTTIQPSLNVVVWSAVSKNPPLQKRILPDAMQKNRLNGFSSMAKR